MSTITLPNIRVSSDLTVKLKLKDGGVAIDWSTLQNIKVGIHSDAQRAKAGNCGTTIDAEDPTILVCTYAANKPQYLGVNRVIVTAKYRGETKTYDKPAFNFVRWTDDQAGEQITIDDPDVDVKISVEDISSSILQEAVDEAFTAADRANDAAAAAEHMVDIHTGPEGKSAYEVAVEEGYTGTEEEWLASLKGPVGETPDISIGTVTTVEPGTPAAASMSGTPEAPVLNLSIPKGLVGATPNFTVGTVTTGEPGSSVIVTITGTPEAPVLNVTIPQGMQGNTGSSVEFPYELVNNLTTNDATKGLSAAQGVVLDGKVSQLEAKVTDLDTTPTWDSNKMVTSNGVAEKVAPTIMKSIPFDGGNRYIAKATGVVANNSGWISTPYIPVSEGDEFVYSGTPGSVSQAVAGYSFDGTDYVYVFGLLYGVANDPLSQKTIIIPPGITHILAVDKKSGNASLTKKTASALSGLQEHLGDIYDVEVFRSADFINVGYAKSDGTINTTSTSYHYIEKEVKAGTTVELYDLLVTPSHNCATIAKKLSESECRPLLVLTEEKTYEKVTFFIDEDMTVFISSQSTSGNGSPRVTALKYNKIASFEGTTQLLGQTRQEIAVRNATEDVLAMELGRLFENIAVIGDSMSRGTLGGESDPNLDNDGTGMSSFGASWLSCLAKRWGCKSKFHYANSGTSTYLWLNDNFYGLGRMLMDEKVYNAYFIAYGHNDAMGAGSVDDAPAPVTITEDGGVISVSCPDGYSFCSYYKAIINQIRTKAPYAMIFCLSEYDGVMVSKTAYRQAIIDVAEQYYNNGDQLVHHLETGGVPVSGMDLGTHYSTIGYAYIAKMVDIRANEVVYAHREDISLKYFGSYNTDHNADSPWE